MSLCTYQVILDFIKGGLEKIWSSEGLLWSA
jgi:hypothetical protein